MSDGMNKVMLLGNLGADPELRYTASGVPLLSLRLATNETFLDRQREMQERTEWHNVVMWGSRAEPLSRLLSKGDCVLIEGSLRTTSFDKDGLKRWRTEVVARELRFTGRRQPPALPDDGLLPDMPMHDAPLQAGSMQPASMQDDALRPPATARGGRKAKESRPGPVVDAMPY
ncbi:single-stranded DNA-binding protein [Chondromyces crocatus]|uniref:Single-stranded DNA-binding protein n=1 Tax=Chondromyces crocatus TaxID=52 RepID=A0A0K1EED6_CHOCO|nr:single-stranded DNA-binding protein [Chondromyces crocatus]AKT39230.1 uncharacterized protein CMC5_033790 [Chondromyces crocatus]